MTKSEFFIKLIELPSIGKDDQQALLRVLFDRSRDMTVDRKMPPMKFFKNIKLKRTDTDRVTNAQQQQDIWFERVLPYLVTYPKSFMTFAGICKRYNFMLYQNTWLIQQVVSDTSWKTMSFGKELDSCTLPSGTASTRLDLSLSSTFWSTSEKNSCTRSFNTSMP